MLSRRAFINKIGVGLGSLPFLNLFTSCNSLREVKISGRIVGANARVGHMLRQPIEGETVVSEETDIVIVGAGVAGLSAARWINKNSNYSLKVLELDEREGGNAASGENEVSAYPWGAHYLPIPNPDNIDLCSFLEEHDIITHYNDHGIPYFNEYYLCHDPEERLYIRGQWQDGLMPVAGLPLQDLEQIRRFMQEMEHWKHEKGNDGKFAFAIPVDHSSSDTRFVTLDSISMEMYLKDKGFDSPFLLWYIDYCCKDDYGTSLKNTSAWAGLHYFASRRGSAANADPSAVLTWPQGNRFLTDKLKNGTDDKIKKEALVYSVSIEHGKVQVEYIDTKTGKRKRILADKCIVCTPQFVTRRILKVSGDRSEDMYKKFTYAPWMVANITVNNLMERRGRPMSWDNVIFNSPSLGYINANHQDLKASKGKKVLTYYYPMVEGSPVDERIKAQKRNHQEWVQLVLKDLKVVHENIEEAIENIDLWIWGHGMIRPVPGFITGKERESAKKQIANKIFFAHSDLSGLSLFEEAFYHGIRAAKEAIAL